MRHFLLVVVAAAVLAGGCGGEGSSDSPNEPSGSPATTEPTGLAAAQEELDPEDDPGALLHRTPDGSWALIHVNYDGRLPDWVKTTEHFSRFKEVLQALKPGARRGFQEYLRNSGP